MERSAGKMLTAAAIVGGFGLICALFSDWPTRIAGFAVWGWFVATLEQIAVKSK